MMISMRSFIFALFMLFAAPALALEGEAVVLPATSALAHRVKTTSEKMFDEIKNAKVVFAKQLVSLKLKATGPMMAEFLASSEGEYAVTFYLPVNEPQSFVMPSGKRLKFVHKGAYELIDETYDEIADALDEKKLTAQDMVLEEYITDIDGEPNLLQVVIYVALKAK